jgi:hypothetical protein
MSILEILKELEGKTIKDINIRHFEATEDEQVDIVFTDKTCATIYNESNEMKISLHE